MNIELAKIYAHGDGYLIYEEISELGYCNIKILIDSDRDLELMNNLNRVTTELEHLKRICCDLKLDVTYKERLSSSMVSAMMGCIEEAKLNFMSIEEDIIAQYT